MSSASIATAAASDRAQVFADRGAGSWAAELVLDELQLEDAEEEAASSDGLFDLLAANLLGPR